ncbi:uncharacterized protein PV06_04799 [Exophiala oligosperma]|uniref:Phytocyanin domain-containing protein n=2 Tax=Chaetothyriales TaxID=34395 RepID=A0A0D2C1W5_9EURO|nr:uncharacterized protein PV06_04799 [Exophiala oligosperma]KAJ9621390.1 hypothetical protein H2204_011951 [Knufia peltigerae]KIW43727.1 hypothetical protein PV06_04799 [Exophiala oligosperma]
MSLKSLLFSTLLATGAVATYGGGQGQSSWGGGSGGGGGSWGAAPSCPAGCQPITPPPAGGNGQLIVQVVSVSDSNGSLKYFPNNIEAPVGSIVQFQYHPKNHTVTESSFAEPCKPISANLTTPMRPGLKSGFVPVKGNESTTPVFNVLVNDTKPIWIFCGQTNHCQKGMAMVINQNSSTPNTIDAYIANAAKLPLADTPPAPPASAPPPPAANTVTFGGSPPPANTAPAPPPPAPAAESAATPPSSSVPAAPAVFTGAAVRAREASAGMLVLGALVAAW